MKLRIFSGIGLATISVVVLASTILVQGSGSGNPASLSASPTPTISISTTHKPYDPFESRATLPEYPDRSDPPKPRPEALLTKPPGVDLDVTYISRNPLYSRYEVWYTHDGKPYLSPGTEDDQMASLCCRIAR